MIIDKITPENRPLFRNTITKTRKRPNIENEIRIEDASFPMKGNPFFEYNPVALAAIEWDRLAEFSENIMPNNMQEFMQLSMTMMRTHGEVEGAESDYHAQIPIIAENIVRTIFNVPDNIEFDFEIGMAHSIDSSSGACEEEKKDAVDQKLLPYIHQRQIINAITHGASVFLTERLYFVGQEELDALNDTLVPLYQRYSRVVNLSNWYVGESMLGGSLETETPEETTSMVNPSKVDIEKTQSGWMIKVTAPNLPLILHESVKGLLELLSYWAIPKVNNELDEIESFMEPINRDLTEDELSLVLKVADSYRDERWYYYMGPTIWSRLIAHYNVGADEISAKLKELYTLSPRQFLTQIENIIFRSDV